MADREITEPGFWNDQRNAQKVQRKRKKIESGLELVRRVNSQEGDVAVLQEWLAGGEPVGADLKTAALALSSTQSSLISSFNWDSRGFLTEACAAKPEVYSTAPASGTTRPERQGPRPR